MCNLLEGKPCRTLGNIHKGKDFMNRRPVAQKNNAEDEHTL